MVINVDILVLLHLLINIITNLTNIFYRKKRFIKWFLEWQQRFTKWLRPRKEHWITKWWHISSFTSTNIITNLTNIFYKKNPAVNHQVARKPAVNHQVARKPAVNHQATQKIKEAEFQKVAQMTKVVVNQKVTLIVKVAAKLMTFHMKSDKICYYNALQNQRGCMQELAGWNQWVIKDMKSLTT